MTLRLPPFPSDSFRGPVAHFLRSYESEMAKHTDAPEIFHSAVAVTLLAACLTRHRYRVHLAGGVPSRRTNLWTFLVGDSSHSRKSTAVNMGAAVLDRAMPELRTPDDGSPEGFAKDFVMKATREDDDAAGILVQSEMGLFLMNLQKEYMRPMKGMFMEFYDCPPVFRRKLSREEFTVKNPRLSMLGGVATELLPNLTSTEDWLGGFMNRALIIHAKRTRETEEGVTPSSETFDHLSRTLLRAVKDWKSTRIAAQKKLKNKSETWLFNFDDEGRKELRKLKKDLPPATDPNVNLLRGRADVHIMKLAACEQIADDPTRTGIGKKAVLAAWPLFHHWWCTAPDVMEQAFARSNEDLQGDRLARRIIRLVRDAGPRGFPEMELMAATIMSWEHFQKALTTLDMGGFVERIDLGDGRGTVVKWKKGAPEARGD